MKKLLYSKFILTLLVASLLPLFAHSQITAYSFEQLDSLQSVAPRNAVIFIHTDWCQYCQSMKNTTFVNQDLTKLINESFWFVDFNGEEKRDISFHGGTFRYKPTGQNTGVHELAEQLALKDGKLSYPSLCVLNADYEIVFLYDQFLSADDLILALDTILKSN